jgi:hypothetical protein
MGVAVLAGVVFHKVAKTAEKNLVPTTVPC